MAAVLFNIAACESFAGVQQDRSKVEGLKRACQHFQQAAGVFKFVREEVCKELTGMVTSDLTAPGLSLLENMMLAQAQACFYEKAVKDKMQTAIVAKLATQAASFYMQSLNFARHSELIQVLDKTWGGHLQFQNHCFKAAAQYWQAITSKKVAQDKGVGYGEEVARLQIAVTEADAAITTLDANKLPASLKGNVEQLLGLVHRNMQAAIKDLQTVYHQPVPKASQLKEIAMVAIVKPLPLPDITAITGDDLFKGLVPMSVTIASTIYIDKAESLKRELNDLTNTQNDFVRSKLGSVGLPAALEAHDHGAGLPDSVWHRIRTTQDQGGLQMLQTTLQQNKTTSEFCHQQLQDAESKLGTEELEDRECREQYGQQWKRPASTELNKNFRDDIDRYYKLLRDSSQSDEHVQTTLAEQATEFDKLKATRKVLDSQFPAISHAQNKVDTNKLSRLLVEMGQLVQDRDQDYSAFVEALNKVDIVSVIMATGDKVPHEQLFEQEIQKFSPFKDKIQNSVTRQSQLLENIIEENSVFRAARQADEVTMRRESLIQNLEAAVHKFEQVYSNVQEGAAFYRGLREKIEVCRSQQ